MAVPPDPTDTDAAELRDNVMAAAAASHAIAVGVDDYGQPLATLGDARDLLDTLGRGLGDAIAAAQQIQAQTHALYGGINEEVARRSQVSMTRRELFDRARFVVDEAGYGNRSPAYEELANALGQMQNSLWGSDSTYAVMQANMNAVGEDIAAMERGTSPVAAETLANVQRHLGEALTQATGTQQEAATAATESRETVDAMLHLSQDPANAPVLDEMVSRLRSQLTPLSRTDGVMRDVSDATYSMGRAVGEASMGVSPVVSDEAKKALSPYAEVISTLEYEDRCAQLVAYALDNARQYHPELMQRIDVEGWMSVARPATEPLGLARVALMSTLESWEDVGAQANRLQRGLEEPAQMLTQASRSLATLAEDQGRPQMAMRLSMDQISAVAHKVKDVPPAVATPTAALAPTHAVPHQPTPPSQGMAL